MLFCVLDMDNMDSSAADSEFCRQEILVTLLPTSYQPVEPDGGPEDTFTEPGLRFSCASTDPWTCYPSWPSSQDDPAMVEVIYETVKPRYLMMSSNWRAGTWVICN